MIQKGDRVDLSLNGELTRGKVVSIHNEWARVSVQRKIYIKACKDLTVVAR